MNDGVRVAKIRVNLSKALQVSSRAANKPTSRAAEELTEAIAMHKRRSNGGKLHPEYVVMWKHALLVSLTSLRVAAAASDPWHASGSCTALRASTTRQWQRSKRRWWPAMNLTWWLYTPCGRSFCHATARAPMTWLLRRSTCCKHKPCTAS